MGGVAGDPGWPTQYAGVWAAGELAQLAIQENGFGVFEDKVLKKLRRADQPAAAGVLPEGRVGQGPLRRPSVEGANS